MRKTAIIKRFLISALVLLLIFPQMNVAAADTKIGQVESEDDTKELFYTYNIENVNEDYIYLYSEQNTLEENILTEIPNSSEIIVSEEKINDEIHTEDDKDFIFVEYTTDPVENEKEESYQGYILADYIFNEEELKELVSNEDNEAVESNDEESAMEDANTDVDGNEESAEEDADTDVDGDQESAEEDADTDVDGDQESVEEDANTDVDGDQESVEEDADTDVDGDQESVEEDANTDVDGDQESVEEDTDTDVDGDEESAEEDADTDVDGDQESVEEDADTDVDGDQESVEEDADTDVDGNEESAEEDADTDVDGDQESVEEDADTDVDGGEESVEEDADTDVDGDEESAEEDAKADQENGIDTEEINLSTFSMYVQPFAISQTQLTGIALNNRTHVYQSASTNSNILKSYTQGSILKYRENAGNWYRARVYTNGKWQWGYIHKNHVENATSNQKVIEGIAKQGTTRVYQSASTGSGTLKTYSSGHILKYRTFSNNWYQARVKVNGKWKLGYIHKNDVENATSSQKLIEGIAKQGTTRVYQSASTGSGTLKTYSSGHILKYRTFSNNWYQARVKVNGKWKLGYIHKNDVENATSNQKVIEGIAKQGTTRVYQSASTGSGTLKTYSSGHILKYRTFSSNWYQARVKVNGEWKLGYIHKNDVENATSNQKVIEGIAKQGTTRVYQSASTGSGTLKTYSSGHILKYRTFSSNWYQARVKVNGEWKLGYIHKNHVENATSNKVSSQGYGNQKPTNVYVNASKNSRVLKSYSYGSILKFRSFSSGWYQTNVYIKGVKHTGYIRKSDISSQPLQPSVTHNSVAYNYTFKHMVDRQMAGTPKSDGAGNIPATRGEVEFFSNPNNFSPADQEFFQFLVLSGPGGFSAAEINKKILIGAGTLSGKGQAFINAAKQNNINEAYLIAHAMHETGNGKSTLAQGVPVDAKGNVTRNSNGQIAKTSNTKHTVYNMYGYGAPDASPINGGAKYAFDHGWFTPEAAIIGGAGSINTYISRGQDTLYKMRWNPDDPGYPQYATHVRWATGQTKRIYDIYQLVDNYEAVYEIPNFNSIPNAGNVMASALNVRLGPGTNNNSIGSLTNGTQVKIIGSNPNGWYQIESGKTKGWVSSMYINLKH